LKRFPVIGIRSVELGTPDLTRSEEFYTKVWGLQAVARIDDVVYLRASGRDHHVLTLRAHNTPEVLSVTFRIAERAHLQQLADSVEAAGGTVLSSVGPNNGPDGGTVVTLRTPEGYIFRLIHGDMLHPVGGPRRDFPLRLSHVNLNCSNIEATREFFEKALGFCLTDRSKMMVFLRCNQDHHAVVLADSGVDGMNHIAFMMPYFESVMRGSGRMVDNGYPIGWGVGRHGPGDNIFAYFVDLTGFVIEYTAEVLQVDDAYTIQGPDYWVWPPGRTDHWGIAPPKPDSMKHAQLAIRFTRNNP
jgi:catechol 2,3-dioxygenase-like lactoylglutathione lyase family enzyme